MEAKIYGPKSWNSFQLINTVVTESISREGSVFGQDAPIHQLLSVVGTIVMLVLYLTGDVHVAVLVLSLAALAFWFAIPGHGLVYGPHLWLLVIADTFGLRTPPEDRAEKQAEKEDEETNQ